MPFRVILITNQLIKAVSRNYRSRLFSCLVWPVSGATATPRSCDYVNYVESTLDHNQVVASRSSLLFLTFTIFSVCSLPGPSVSPQVCLFSDRLNELRVTFERTHRETMSMKRKRSLLPLTTVKPEPLRSQSPAKVRYPILVLVPLYDALLIVSLGVTP